MKHRRPSSRAHDQLRPLSFQVDVSKYAEGSCMVKMGDTHILVTATVESGAPGWRKASGEGWITAEYGMLPRATDTRTAREARRGQQSGRTQEIQRLIGRSLRAITDMKVMGDLQIKIDCDVLQADGGTRCASISGAYVALAKAMQYLVSVGVIDNIPLREPVAAVSCGLVDGHALLDLDYQEDSQADVDANFVLTGSGRVVEIQGTAEQQSFERNQFDHLFDLAQNGIKEIVTAQKEAIG